MAKITREVIFEDIRGQMLLVKSMIEQIDNSIDALNQFMGVEELCDRLNSQMDRKRKERVND